MTFKKTVIALLILVFSIAGFGFFAGSAFSATQPHTISFGFCSSGWLIPSYYADVLKERVEQYSEGRLELEVHKGGSLCCETSCVEQLQQGAIDVAELSTENFGSFTDTFLVYDLPYFFESREMARKAAQGEAFKYLQKKCETKDNMKCLAILSTYGHRDLWQNAKEIRVPSDTKGLKIRVTHSPIPALITKAWGATPINVPWAEVYQASQTRVIHGNYQPTGWQLASKLYEVQPFCTEVSPTYNFIIVVMSLDAYNGLPKDLQVVFDKAVKEANEETWEYDAKEDARCRKELIDHGVKFYKPTPEEMELWKRPAMPVLEQFKKKVDPAVITLMESLRDK